MTDEFVMGAGSLPVGTYAVEFLGGEAFEDVEDKFGNAAKYRLKFRVLSGPLADQEASRICNRAMTPKSILAKFAVGLKGSAIAAGESFSFANYVGARGSIVSEPTEGGGSKIAMFLREQPAMPQAQPMPAPVQQPPMPRQSAPVPQAQPMQPQPVQVMPPQPPTPEQSTQQQVERF